ncbi:MAG: hypothetical protein HY706_18260 [Candidatus Hydrogenedentes bacterium]|nr:hypothetical protein [Candidatus Hydrogenedentota bacterium]
MECALCNVRSSVGYCIECQVLLCEECSAKCENCQKLLCPDHKHETRGGRVLCVECYEERKQRRAERRVAVAADSEKDHAAEEVPEGEVGDEALVASVRKPPPPWKLSLYSAAAGIAAILIILVLPSLRRITLVGSSYLPTPYILLPIPIFAIFWAAIGLYHKDYQEDRPRSWIGLGLAVVTILLAFVARWTDPALQAEEEVRQQQEKRLHMNVEERTEWRQNMLNRYNQ